jgi:hypothetical protein
MSIDHIEQILKSSAAFTGGKGIALIEEAIDLYEKTRVEGTNVDQDGDMLLFQWGTFDWGDGKNFEVDLTRQITLDLPDPDDAADSMQQLHLQLLYPCSASTENLGRGSKWCGSPGTLSEFKRFLSESDVFLFASTVQPAKIAVSLDYV